MGHALRQRQGLPEHDHVGAEHARSAGAPGTVPGALDGGRRDRTQAFAISRNTAAPGLKDADLAEQFTLAIQIRDKVSQANEAVVRIRSVKDQAAPRETVGGGAEGREAVEGPELGESLTTKLTESRRSTISKSQQPVPAELSDQLNTSPRCRASWKPAMGSPRRGVLPCSRSSPPRLDAELAKLDAALKIDLPLSTRKSRRRD